MKKTILFLIIVTHVLLFTFHYPGEVVFGMEYAKIPRDTSQNSIAAGNLE